MPNPLCSVHSFVHSICEAPPVNGLDLTSPSRRAGARISAVGNVVGAPSSEWCPFRASHKRLSLTYTLSFSLLFSLTVFLAAKKEIVHKKSYIHIGQVTRQLGQNLTLILKLVSNSSMQFQKGMIFVIGISGEMTRQFLTRTLGLLAFDVDQF